MEQVKDIMTEDSILPATRAERSKYATERRRDSKTIERETDQELYKSNFAIRSDVAVAENWEMTEPPPEPSACQFCGKALYHYGVKDLFGKHRVFEWFKKPEHCDCASAAAYWQEQERIRQELEEAERQREKTEAFNAKVRALIQDSGMRGRFTNRTFERFEVNDVNRRAYEKCKRYADSFEIMLPTEDEQGRKVPPKKERNGLFIAGGYGTGKTHLAAAIANELLNKGTAVICMTMIDLLAKIKNSFESGEGATEAEIMKLYEDIPLLIIDDIGSEQPTEWGSARIYSIINARYEAYMPTIVTTNYKGAELIRRMTPMYGGKLSDTKNAEKTLDRLREMCAGIEMSWQSWRAK